VNNIRQRSRALVRAEDSIPYLNARRAVPVRATATPLFAISCAILRVTHGRGTRGMIPLMNAPFSRLMAAAREGRERAPFYRSLLLERRGHIEDRGI